MKTQGTDNIHEELVNNLQTASKQLKSLSQKPLKSSRKYSGGLNYITDASSNQTPITNYSINDLSRDGINYVIGLIVDDKLDDVITKLKNVNVDPFKEKYTNYLLTQKNNNWFTAAILFYYLDKANHLDDNSKQINDLLDILIDVPNIKNFKDLADKKFYASFAEIFTHFATFIDQYASNSNTHNNTHMTNVNNIINNIYFSVCELLAEQANDPNKVSMDLISSINFEKVKNIVVYSTKNIDMLLINAYLKYYIRENDISKNTLDMFDCIKNKDPIAMLEQALILGSEQNNYFTNLSQIENQKTYDKLARIIAMLLQSKTAVDQNIDLLQKHKLNQNISLILSQNISNRIDKYDSGLLEFLYDHKIALHTLTHLSNQINNYFIASKNNPFKIDDLVYCDFTVIDNKLGEKILRCWNKNFTSITQEHLEIGNFVKEIGKQINSKKQAQPNKFNCYNLAHNVILKIISKFIVTNSDKLQSPANATLKCFLPMSDKKVYGVAILDLQFSKLNDKIYVTMPDEQFSILIKYKEKNISNADLINFRSGFMIKNDEHLKKLVNLIGSYFSDQAAKFRLKTNYQPMFKLYDHNKIALSNRCNDDNLQNLRSTTQFAPKQQNKLKQPALIIKRSISTPEFGTPKISKAETNNGYMPSLKI